MALGRVYLTNACSRQSLLSRLVLAHKPRQTGEAPDALAAEANVRKTWRRQTSVAPKIRVASWSAVAQSALLGVFFAICVIGCSSHAKDGVSIDEGATLGQSASSIEIIYRWGFRYHNALNTRAGTITKDLISNGTVTVPFVLSTEQKRRVVQYADSIGFWELPTVITFPDTLETIEQRSPHQKYLLVIRDGEKMNAVLWDTEVTNPIAERDLIKPLGDMIRQIVVQSEEYRSLPKVEGGYL